MFRSSHFAFAIFLTIIPFLVVTSYSRLDQYGFFYFNTTIVLGVVVIMLIYNEMSRNVVNIQKKVKVPNHVLDALAGSNIKFPDLDLNDFRMEEARRIRRGHLGRRLNVPGCANVECHEVPKCGPCRVPGVEAALSPKTPVMANGIAKSHILPCVSPIDNPAQANNIPVAAANSGLVQVATMKPQNV